MVVKRRRSSHELIPTDSESIQCTVPIVDATESERGHLIIMLGRRRKLGLA